MAIADRLRLRERRTTCRLTEKARSRDPVESTRKSRRRYRSGRQLALPLQREESSPSPSGSSLWPEEAEGFKRTPEDPNKPAPQPRISRSALQRKKRLNSPSARLKTASLSRKIRGSPAWDRKKKAPWGLVKTRQGSSFRAKAGSVWGRQERPVSRSQIAKNGKGPGDESERPRRKGEEGQKTWGGGKKRQWERVPPCPVSPLAK